MAPRKSRATLIPFRIDYFSEVGKTIKSVYGVSCKIACAPREDSDQPVHPRSLIRVFVGHCG